MTRSAAEPPSAETAAEPRLAGPTIGVDVGGTKVAAGVVDSDGRVLARTKRPTPSYSPGEIVELVGEVVAELRESHPDVVAVGVGAAGWVDAERARVVYAPNLAWRDEPLRDRLAQTIDVPVVIENDANAAAWAEHRFGAARGEPHVVLVTAGTGIGTGIVFDGALYRGGHGMAGEAGHMTVVRDGLPCPCGQRGCWEQYASGNALVRLARERAAAEPSRARVLLELGGGDPVKIEGAQVTEAAEAGDPVAVECFADVGRWLGEGLADLAAVLDPSVFVVGGGVADAGELLLAPARSAYAARLTGGAHRTPAEVRVAELGNEAGLVGAADLARRP
ncbi:MAG TPA: ROK family glucokinase [Mycobacteriales bacterium]|nr:ROK family glucokinase [Mycobacteriales bacterium]